MRSTRSMALLLRAAVVLLLLSLFLLGAADAFSMTLSETAQQARSHLQQALSSPSGKLTFSPEIILPEPKDPTALLLQTNAIQTLSKRLRDAKANTCVLAGSTSPSAIQTFCAEQELARGNFPGPVPVIYAASQQKQLDFDMLAQLADTGVDGAVVPVCGGAVLTSVDDIISSGDDNWKELCQAALEQGIQPIPEVTLDETATWGEAEMEAVVASLSLFPGEDADEATPPVAVLVSMMNPTASNDDDDDSNNEQQQQQQEPADLPTVPKTLGKTTPILGSVRATAGDNRLNVESQRFKAAGFTGALLRSDCVPGFRLNPDLEIVGAFWAAAVTDLKSTKSKSFSFRSKNNMEESSAHKWAKYQKGILDSGALGDPNDNYSVVDEAAGEYKGFV